jgi:hypothetical protein
LVPYSKCGLVEFGKILIQFMHWHKLCSPLLIDDYSGEIRNHRCSRRWWAGWRCHYYYSESYCLKLSSQEQGSSHRNIMTANVSCRSCRKIYYWVCYHTERCPEWSSGVIDGIRERLEWKRLASNSTSRSCLKASESERGRWGSMDKSVNQSCL